jgi:hypothetical protein
MRARLILAGVVLCFLAGAPAALASTQTATAGGVTATFTFAGKYPNYRHERLQIAQGGSVVYDQPVVARLCGTRCAPGSSASASPSVHVIDLEHTGRPDVVLDLFSGGAHCCTVEQIFSVRPGTTTYDKVGREFGDPGARIVDLRRDGRYEFLTADDAFAYAFTDFAASGLPLQILTFTNGQFRDVTRSYPGLVAKDAAGWLHAFKRMAAQRYVDSVGVIAAWAADEDRLGHRRLVNRYLAKQVKAGHLNSGLAPDEPSGARFVAKLQRFLRRHGYLR